MSMQKVFLSTEEVDPTCRVDFWREVNCLFADVTPQAQEDHHVYGVIEAQHFGSMATASIASSPQMFVRDQRLITLSNLDHYLIQYITEGEMIVDCQSGLHKIREGDICILDLTKPYAIRATSGKRINTMLPREIVEGRRLGQSMHGVFIRSRDPLGATLRQLLVELQRGDIRGDDAEVAMNAISILLPGICSRDEFISNSMAGSLSQTLQRRITSFIQENIASPNLGVDTLMRQFRVSRSHIYRSFESEGGLATYIRNVRLNTAYRCLARNSFQQKSISSIAFEHGFKSSSQFSRAFRKRFGLPPKEVKLFAPMIDERHNAVARIHRHLSDLVSYSPSALPPENWTV